MELFFERNKVLLFSMKLDPSATVLEMKQRIEKYTGISISNQTIFFKGKILHTDRDSHTLKQCKIVKKSRLELHFSLLRLKRDRALQQTEQSPAPSSSVQDVINNERNQDSSNNNDQVLHQIEKSLIPSWSIDEIFGTEWVAATEGNVSVQEPSWRYNNFPQDWLQRESSSTSNMFGDFSLDEDPPFSTELFANIQEDYNQVLQPTEQSLVPSMPVQASLGQFQDWSVTASSISHQMLDQREQSLVPSTPVQDSLGQFQDWSVTASSIFHQMPDQWELSLARSAMMGRHDTNHDLLQSDEPSSTLNTFGEDLPFPTELFSNIQSHCPASTTDNSNVFQTEQSTIPLNTLEDLLFGEDPPLSTQPFSNFRSHWPASTTEDIFTNTEQVFQTEQPLVPSNSTEQRSNQVVQTEKSPLMKEVINVPDSPVKVRKFRKPPQRLRVMVLPHSPDNEPVSKVPVSVMANENVEELRKKLEKIRERNELKLPEKGYFFIHKQNVLDDERSFLWNGVAHGDTIEIFPGYVTKDGRTFGL